jgi:tetratricopeptide (TPR) repeat protein
VLIGPHGAIDDCVHDERTHTSATDGDHAPLLARLVADGYQVASTDLERARGLVAAAARQTTSSSEAAAAKLSSAYYLGRDLLDLGEAHLGGRVHAHPTSTSLGRAVELLADGDVARAHLLLSRCADSADTAAATGACLLAQNRIAEALPHLLRAAELEPDFPLHHWNLAAVLHHLGDSGSLAACYAALRRFLSTSEVSTGLVADPEQPSRVVLALRLCSDLERTARLTGLELDAVPARKRRRAPKREAAKQ